MPTINPFPLDIEEKVNLPELAAFFVQFGKNVYLSAEDVNFMIQGMQYLYENIDPTANPNLLQLGETATTAYRGDRGKAAYDFVAAHGNVDNTSDINKPVSIAQAAADALVAGNANGYSNNLILNLKDGVSTAGNTLQKLYNLILGASSQDYVANISQRNAYNIPKLPFSLFVIDDGDGKWAIYQATTIGVNANYVKISDPDLLNALMSSAAIKTAYESNADTNAFTNALLFKLNAIANNATSNNADAFLLNRSNHSGTQLASTISDFTSSVNALITYAKIISSLGFTPEDSSKKGVANGYVPLNSSIKIDNLYLSDTILGQMLYGGTLNLATNLATLTDNAKNKLNTTLSAITLTNNTNPVTGYLANQGIFYICSGADAVFAGLDLKAGDWLVSNSTSWSKVDNTDALISFNGRLGAIILLFNDIITALGFTPLSPLNNLSEVNKALARVNLEIDKTTIFGNANYNSVSTDKIIASSVALTANRTVLLSTGLLAGKELVVTDQAGVVGTFNIIISVPTGKKLNGVVNGTETIRAAFGWRRLLADGDDNFTFDAGIQRVIQNKTISTSTYTLLDLDSTFFLIFTASCVVTVPAGLTNLQFQGIQSTFNQPVSFVASSGVTLAKSASENAQTAEQYSVFGIRFLYTTTTQIYSLFGRLQQI